MKNMTLAHITEVCGGIYFGPEEKENSGSHGYRDGQPESGRGKSLRCNSG